MGVIQRQGIKNSIVNYVGVIIGAISTLFIYPLDFELYGSVQVWIASASLMIPFLALGSNSLIIKYFPYYRSNKLTGFLKQMLLLTIGIIFISSIFIFIFKGYILESNIIPEDKKNMFIDDFNIIYPISIFLILIQVARSFAANFKRIVVPDLIQNLGFKVYLPILFLITYYGYLNYSSFKLGIIIFYGASLVLMFIYLKYIKALDFTGSIRFRGTRTKKKEMRSFMLFSSMDQVGNFLAYQIDKIMLGTIISKTSAGLYSPFLFLSTIIDIPTRAIFQIAGPIVSELFEKKDLPSIEKMYKKISINLLIIGVFMFSIVWINIDTILSFMTNGDYLIPFKKIFLYLGLAKLVIMLASINNYIITYSKYYKYNLIFITIIAILNISMNIYFIELYGVIGSGIATAIAIFFYHFIKSTFIYIVLKIHPLSTKHIILLLILVMILLVKPYLSNIIFDNIILNSIIISIILTLSYIYIIYITKISIDYNMKVDIVIKKIKKTVKNYTPKSHE